MTSTGAAKSCSASSTPCTPWIMPRKFTSTSSFILHTTRGRGRNEEEGQDWLAMTKVRKGNRGYPWGQGRGSRAA